MAALKIGALKDVILRFAKALNENGASSSASVLTRACDALASDSQTPLASIVKSAAGIQFPKAEWGGGPRVETALKPLASLRALLEGQSKTEILNGLDELSAFLRLAPDADLDTFVRTVQDAPRLVLQSKEEAVRRKAEEAARKKAETAAKKAEEAARKKAEQAAKMTQAEAAANLPPFGPDDVPSFVKKLRAALGDAPAFLAIFAELKGPRLQQPEAVAIASEISGYMPPTTKKPQALKRIEKAHQNIVDFRRHPSAAQRSAA